MGNEQQESTVAVASPPKDLWCGISIPTVGITGPKWSGKSVLVSSIDPEGTLMVDLEMSTESYGFIRYKKRVSLYHELSEKIKDRAPTSLDCWLWFNDVIEKVKPMEFSVIAVDPINDIEAGLATWVYNNAELFGHTKKQYDYASGILQGDISSYWKLKLGILAAKIQTLAFTTHIGSVWGSDGKPLPGKTKPKGRPVLTELASLYLELERKPNNDGIMPAKPTARVLKSRLMVGEFLDGEMKLYPVLAGSIPECTPNKIREYIKNPIGKRQITDAEKAAPEIQLTEDERLLLKTQIVGEQLQIEQSKSSRMELLAAAAKRNNNAANVVASQPVNPVQSAVVTAAVQSSDNANVAAAEVLEKAKRTRRTKEQIEADNAKEAAEKAAKTDPNLANANAIINNQVGATTATVQPTTAQSAEVSPAQTTATEPTASTQPIGTPEAPFNPTGQTPTIHQTVNAQLAELMRVDPGRWTEKNIKSTLNTRFKVDAVTQLSAEQGETLRKSLWDVLTKMGLSGDGISSKN